MYKYFDNLNPEIKEYFKILSNDIPSFLEEYINTKEMQRIGKISMSCGTDYSKCFNVKYFYSNLDHSVAVALIIWNFTHDKKQTLSGLFHDISTPVFKHCIDFMNGDSINQESTEERTISIIKNSKEIMDLLKRDNIKLEEVCDYKMYPIADNNLPKLSADRFEYNFSSGLSFYRVWDIDSIRKIYSNIVVVKNEEGIDELAFKDKNICEEYIEITSKLWPEWVSDKDRTVMQFLADMCKSLNIINELSIDDLYLLSEKEVINKFYNCSDEYLKNTWLKFCDTDKVFKSNYKIDNKYCINVKSKTRYVNPLVISNNSINRIYDISLKSKENIDKYLNIEKGGYYTYFDFEFEPYKEKVLKR